VSVDT